MKWTNLTNTMEDYRKFLELATKDNTKHYELVTKKRLEFRAYREKTLRQIKKLEKKNLDFIVLNSTRNEGTTFQSDDNKIKIIRKTSEIEYSKKNKKVVACDIIDQLVAEIEQ